MCERSLRGTTIGSLPRARYLPKFSGDFEGGAEELRIQPTQGWWYLQAKRGGYSAIGSARCMSYDQRWTTCVAPQDPGLARSAIVEGRRMRSPHVR
jgi:hypothetical protein